MAVQQPMTADAFAAATAGTTEQREIKSRKVANGYVFSAVKRFMEDNGATRLAFAVETVATDWDTGIAEIGKYIDGVGLIDSGIVGGSVGAVSSHSIA